MMKNVTRELKERLNLDVEPDAEFVALLAEFDPEEVRTGVVKRGDPSARLLEQGGPEVVRNALAEAAIVRTVGQALAQARGSRAMSLADVAERIGVSRARVAQLERPDANLKIGTLARYAAALDCDVVLVLRPREPGREPVTAELGEVEGDEAPTRRSA